jgi:glycosyltransferase involved in cell wall biosynthesis
MTKMMNVLIELRPALDGFAGIPQETRLLFRQLCEVPNVEVEGLLQSSLQFLHPGVERRWPEDGKAAVSPFATAAGMHAQARVILSLEKKPTGNSLFGVVQYLKRRFTVLRLVCRSLVAPPARIRMSYFRTANFEEYIWQKLFSRTLPPADHGVVTRRDFRVCTTPWNMMQSAGLQTGRFLKLPRYPVLETRGIDVFISQMPYPGRLPEETSLVVRYHDALAVFMPHAFANRERHLATHFNALECNVRHGAWFACVSEAARQDLLRVFPEAAARAVTIHNMVSHHYFEEASSADRVPDIVRARLNDSAATMPRTGALDAFYDAHLPSGAMPYLLMVATVEPRKNHGCLVAAWESLRARGASSLKLVIVGGLGWDTGPILGEMRAGIDRGDLFMLSKVPAAELRVLYRHAAATMCPSLAEGFDFPGVEAMRSGGAVIASDIPVHREVFADAAEYFQTHSSADLAQAIERVVLGADAPERTQQLRARGREVGARYLPERILPQWQAFLARVDAQRAAPGATIDRTRTPPGHTMDMRKV